MKHKMERLRQLVRFYDCGYEEGLSVNGIDEPTKDLVRFGFLERNPTQPLHLRITEKGINYLDIAEHELAGK